MLVKDNIGYAKRNLIDSIWKEANLEGIGVTFPQTQEIIEGRTIAGLSIKDTMVINNLKHAWQFLFDSIDYPLDAQWVSQLHHEIGKNDVVIYPGQRRENVVTIGGTTWVPEIPTYDDLRNTIEEVMGIEDPTDRALEAFCRIAKMQYFNDGNKRTAQLVANKILIENGCGVFAVPEQQLSEFTEKLVKYYETNDSSGLKSFLRGVAIDNPEITSMEEFVPDRSRFIGTNKDTLRDTGREAQAASEVLSKQSQTMPKAPSQER